MAPTGKYIVAAADRTRNYVAGELAALGAAVAYFQGLLAKGCEAFRGIIDVPLIPVLARQQAAAALASEPDQLSEGGDGYMSDLE